MFGRHGCTARRSRPCMPQAHVALPPLMPMTLPITRDTRRRVVRLSEIPETVLEMANAVGGADARHPRTRGRHAQGPRRWSWQYPPTERAREGTRTHARAHARTAVARQPCAQPCMFARSCTALRGDVRALVHGAHQLMRDLDSELVAAGS